MLLWKSHPGTSEGTRWKPWLSVVVAKDIATKEEFNINKKVAYNYEVLGGTHLMLATKHLHSQEPENKYLMILQRALRNKVPLEETYDWRLPSVIKEYKHGIVDPLRVQ